MALDEALAGGVDGCGGAAASCGGGGALGAGVVTLSAAGALSAGGVGVAGVIAAGSLIEARVEACRDVRGLAGVAVAILWRFGAGLSFVSVATCARDSAGALASDVSLPACATVVVELALVLVSAAPGAGVAVATGFTML